MKRNILNSTLFKKYRNSKKISGLPIKIFFLIIVLVFSLTFYSSDRVNSAISAVSKVSTVLGDPYPDLTNSQLTEFNTGRQAFMTPETPAEGLGPAFNGFSCASCHNLGATGGSGVQFETRIGQVTNGIFNPLANEGGELLQNMGIGIEVAGCNFNGEVVPDIANVVARRRTTALFGLGLVDATADSTFKEIAKRQPASIRGRVNMVFNISLGTNTVGKFGWKAQVPTLFQFSGDAYVNEMGVTNPQFPNENPPQGSLVQLAKCDLVPDPEDDGTDVQEFTNFMKLLAQPSRGTINCQVQNGDTLFTKFGCDQCHVRSITSSSNPIYALSNQTYHPYSDFLLHNMGTLGDNIPDQGQATASEMRTQPLWGFRYLNQNNLLHDGRAHSPIEAILYHDGQGAAARDAFKKASAKEKQQLVDFLNSL